MQQKKAYIHLLIFCSILYIDCIFIGKSIDNKLLEFENIFVSIIIGYITGFIFYYLNVYFPAKDNGDKILHSFSYLFGLFLSVKENLDDNFYKIDASNKDHIDKTYDFFQQTIKEIYKFMSENTLYVKNYSYELSGMLRHLNDKIINFEDKYSCVDIYYRNTFCKYITDFLKICNYSIEYIENMPKVFDDGEIVFSTICLHIMNSPCPPVSKSYMKTHYTETRL